MIVKLCFALHKTPDEIRQMSERDFNLFISYLNDGNMMPQDLQAWQMFKLSAMYLGANCKKQDYSKLVKDIYPFKVENSNDNGLNSGYFAKMSSGANVIRINKNKGAKK